MKERKAYRAAFSRAKERERPFSFQLRGGGKNARDNGLLKQCKGQKYDEAYRREIVKRNRRHRRGEKTAIL